MSVLFASVRPLERAENLNAVFKAYDGEKTFVQMGVNRRHPEITSGKHSLLVADEFPAETPGKIVLIGHGMEGGKTYGLDQPHPYVTRRETDLLTCVVSASGAAIAQKAKQCGVPEDRVYPLGAPRTDAYYGKTKGHGGTFLCEKRAYLYAPTYRGRMEPPAPTIEWGVIDSLLTDTEVMVVKSHMMTGRLVRGEYRHITEVPNSEPSTPYLIDCDVLITDYSSIMFDAHLLGKPVVLFDTNTDYLSARGMYRPYPSGYASRFCRDEYSLVKTMRIAKEQGEEDLACRDFSAGACDGHSTERVVDLIRRME